MTEIPVARVIHKTKKYWRVLCPYNCSMGIHFHSPGEGHRVSHCEPPNEQDVGYYVRDAS